MFELFLFFAFPKHQINAQQKKFYFKEMTYQKQQQHFCAIFGTKKSGRVLEVTLSDFGYHKGRHF